MKTIFKIIVLFLIIFNIRVPLFYNSVVIAIILNTLYYIFFSRKISFDYFSNRYVATILISTGLMALMSLLITVFHGEFYDLYIKRYLIILFMLLAMVYALPLFIEGKGKSVFMEALTIVCYTFALQGAIHLTAFIYTPLGEWIVSIKPIEFQQALADPSKNIDRFRGYALTGSVFFELPSAYGVACMAFFRIQLERGQRYISGYLSYIVLFLMVAGIALSGRTGFVGFGFAVLYYLYFSAKSPMGFMAHMPNLGRLTVIVIVLLGTFYGALSSSQRATFTEDLFPFAFEAFYTYEETGKFSMSSTDATNELHYYPLLEETILQGHGTSTDHLFFYKHTDAGYMKSLIFGGVFFLLCLFIYQGLFFITPINLSMRGSSVVNRYDTMLFAMFFVYIAAIHYKDMALGFQHITEVIYLYLGIAYIVSHNSKEISGAEVV